MKSSPSPRRKHNNNNNDLRDSRNSSLSEKMIECWLRQNDEGYQQLLINGKQLELQILNQEAVNRTILKAYDKKKREIGELEAELKKVEGQNLQKKIYLQNYYQFLDSKLKSGPKQVNLFSNIQNLEQNLNARFQSEKRKLETGISELRVLSDSLSQELASLKSRKQSLSQEYHHLKEERQARKTEEQRKWQEYKVQVLQQKQQYDQLVSRRKQLMGQRDKLQRSENIYKRLLNIEEIHKKNWLVIENGIKKQFMWKVKENHYKEALGMEYNLKLPEMERQLVQQKLEYEALKEELDVRVEKLKDAQGSMNTSIEKYSHLQGEMMSHNNRRMTHN